MAAAGNCARFAAKPLVHGGTPAPLWVAGAALEALKPLDWAGCARLVVVAPHPDDETLGLGATCAQLAASGIDVQVVSASDGGAAVPGATPSERYRLETTRKHELARATDLLGVRPPTSLGLPDGELADHEDRLADLLTEILAATPGTWCAATWRVDGHPDHEAVGRAAATACARTGDTLLEYPVWMWHWATPADAAVPWERACAVRLSGWAVERKRRAARCYRSQFEPAPGESSPVLPAFVLQRLLAVGEVVFR
ncbi:acetylglucosaminylphosphatidylinositol deacetylase [Mycobacterium parmense]|uniref:Acetylglucosaminylphosphatidylinositol deacetylase n=1 Tax=Mycobacterium parmense TaxID=185642 RepID=A0A7I7YVL8_9MYCO|nr:LmbE family protein [Mycobacterium parmense]BBZ45347.1 acetylglucosaminylphosphatidylinositol deacetylase [Mycobacterium parmense]